MSANLTNGRFTTLNVVNDSGYLRMDLQGNLKFSPSSMTLSSTGGSSIDANSSSHYRVSSGNLEVNSEAGNLLLYGGGDTISAITLSASSGGMTFTAGPDGMTTNSSGDVTIKSVGNDINLGTPDSNIDAVNSSNDTQNIYLEAVQTIALNSSDIQILAGDSLHLLSLDNDIRMGSSSATPTFQISGGDVKINAASDTTSLYSFQVDTSATSTAKSGYDGILLRSVSNTVTPDITFKNMSGQVVLSNFAIGTESSSSNKSIFRRVIAYQSGTNIIPLGDNTFTSDDVNRVLLWPNDSANGTRATITGVTGIVTVASANSMNSATLTTGGTYSGTSTVRYKVQIVHTGTPDRFRWSNDDGETWQVEQLEITGTAQTLTGTSITITFGATTGHIKYSYWTFSALQVATATSDTVSAQEAYLLDPHLSYINNLNEYDLQISTANRERIRITEAGLVGIGTSVPSSTLEVKSKVGDMIMVNTSNTSHQINPSTASLINGGYVTVWEGKTGSYWDIYGQIFNADGSKSGQQFRVNTAASSSDSKNRTQPHVAGNLDTSKGGFIVVWASESATNDIYDVYCKTFDESIEDIYRSDNDVSLRQLNDTDVSVRASTTYTQKYPRVAGLTDGTYIAVWEETTATANINNIYGASITYNAGTVGTPIVINSDTTLSHNYPYVSGITSDDATHPGKCVISFLEIHTPSSSGGISYSVKYRIGATNLGSFVNAGDVDVSTVTAPITDNYGRSVVKALTSGGFVIAYSKTYQGNSAKFRYIATTGPNDLLTGSISGATGRIADGGVDVTYGNPTKIWLTGVTGAFVKGDVIRGDLSGHSEKVESISTTATGSLAQPVGVGLIELTLSKDVSAIEAKKYDTDSETAKYTVTSMETTSLIDDEELQSLSPAEWIIDNTIFPSSLILPSIDNTTSGKFVACWSNGLVPSIYYQQFTSSTGAKVGSEIKIQTSRSNFKQRNPSVASITNNARRDQGFVVTYDAEVYENSSGHGIFAEHVNPNNHVVHFRNGNTNFILTNSGEIGFGVTNPSSTFHYKNTTPNLIMQNSTVEKNSGLNESKITCQDVSNNSLVEMKMSFANVYESQHPHGTSLRGWWKFNETAPTETATDSTSYGNRGTLINFDKNRCWVTGKFGGALEFDGSNNYVDCGNDTSIGNLAGASGQFTISSWIKVHEKSSSGTTNIIVASDTPATTGRFSLNLNSNSSSKLSGTFYTASDSAKTITGTSKVNDGNWHHVLWTMSETAGAGYQRLFVDGIRESSGNFVGNTENPTGNPKVLIGAESTSSYDNTFYGVIDDLRLYQTTFTSANVALLYQNGNLNKGQLTIRNLDGTTLSSNDTVRTLTFNEDTDIAHLRVKGLAPEYLSGKVTSDGTTAVTGTATEFVDEIEPGDQVDISTSIKFAVSSISSSTSLTATDTVTTGNSGDVETYASKGYAIRRPSIMVTKDYNDNIVGVMNHEGNFGLGEVYPQHKLSIKGTGDTGDLPYIKLRNTTVEDTAGGRESRILFADASDNTLGQIEVSHDGTSADTKGKISFYVNTGSALVEKLTIDSQGNILLNGSTTSATFNITAADDASCNLLLQADNAKGDIQGCNSSIYFRNKDLTGTLEESSFAKIVGSKNILNSSDAVHGRLDFYTNDGANSSDGTLINRMSLISDGSVGFHLPYPTHPFQAAPLLLESPVANASLTGTTLTGTNFDTTAAGNWVGKYIYFTTTKVSRRITAVASGTSATVDVTGTIADQPYKIYHSGLVVNSSGNVGVNQSAPTSNLHLGGSLALPITTVSSATYTVLDNDCVILVSIASTLTLPAVATCTGRIYKFIAIAAIQITIARPTGENINGADASYTGIPATIRNGADLLSTGSEWLVVNTIGYNLT